MNRNEKLVASRWIPKGAYAIRSKRSSAVVYLIDGVGANVAVRAAKPWAIGYVGNSKNHAFNWSFKTPEARAKFVGEWIVAQDEHAASKAGSKADKAEKMSKPQEHLQVGDVLRSSWGYDQTNVDFYEVVELVGKRSVMIREIEGRDDPDCKDYGSTGGRCKPAPGKYKSEPMKKLVGIDGHVKVRSFAYASKVDANSSHYYSWGH